MSNQKYVKLNNGVEMPMAGIGTFLLSPDEAEASVTAALQNGYRLIDTANAYVNEKAVGRAMKKSGIDRKEIFLETKLWPAFYKQSDAVDKTLERLDTSYIDLLLIHQPAGNYIAGYRLMEKAYKEGKVKAIGLSEKYKKSNAQIILRWHIQAGNVIIPGSKNPEHIRDNFDLFDFELTDEEMSEISAVNKDKRYYTNTPEKLKSYVAMVPPVDEQK